jgi:hypothetical protein
MVSANGTMAAAGAFWVFNLRLKIRLQISCRLQGSANFAFP